jgi:RNA-binding protein YhbY
MNVHSNNIGVLSIYSFLETKIYDNTRGYKTAYIIYHKGIKVELIPEIQNRTKSHGHILIKFLSMGETKECKLFARNLKRHLIIKVIMKI